MASGSSSSSPPPRVTQATSGAKPSTCSAPRSFLERKVRVHYVGLFEAPVQVLLNVLPDGIAVGTNDHAAAHWRVVGQLGLAHYLVIPFRKIVFLVDNILDISFFIDHNYPFLFSINEHKKTSPQTRTRLTPVVPPLLSHVATHSSSHAVARQPLLAITVRTPGQLLADAPRRVQRGSICRLALSRLAVRLHQRLLILVSAFSMFCFLRQGYTIARSVSSIGNECNCSVGMWLALILVPESCAAWPEHALQAGWGQATSLLEGEGLNRYRRISAYRYNICRVLIYAFIILSEMENLCILYFAGTRSWQLC